MRKMIRPYESESQKWAETGNFFGIVIEKYQNISSVIYYSFLI